jgi:hypothetical protein
MARGHHLVLYAPPSPAAAAPVLLGAFDRLASDPAAFDRLASDPAGRPRILALAPAVSAGEWARVATLLRGDSPVPVTGTASPERLFRLLPRGGLIFTSPAAARELAGRAALKPAEATALLLIWPEAWEDPDGTFAALLQDVPKEMQRVIVSGDPARAAPLVERHAWRAPTFESPGLGAATPAPAARATPVSWAGRLEALRHLIEQLDPAEVTVWTRDELDHQAIRRVLATIGDAASVTTQPAGVTEATGTAGAGGTAGLTIAYDLPTSTELRELLARGELVLLMPPGTESYVARVAPGHRPLHLLGSLARAREEADRTRRRIAELLERGPAAAELFALAPLFERFEAPAIAATLLGLWREAEGRRPDQAAPSRVEAPVRLWVSVGKRDAATPSDLVALLVRHCEVPREAIGRIEIRESFALVEIAPSAGPELVAERLTGRTIRKRRVVARLDRPSAPVERVAKRLARPKDRRGA